MPITGRDNRVADNPAGSIDHTLLKPTTGRAEIDLLCEQAVEFGFAAVCVPPVFVARAADALYGSGVAVATVVGFPLGYDATATKRFAAQQAIAAGATEIDMVINLAAAEAGAMDTVEQDIAAVVSVCDGIPLKAIIECCLFDDDRKKQLAGTVMRAGAAYVKTSTGFAAGGATIEDVRLLAKAVAGQAKVKAAGGIRDWASCREMLRAGADRIGTSAGDVIMRQWLEAVRT